MSKLRDILTTYYAGVNYKALSEIEELVASGVRDGYIDGFSKGFDVGWTTGYESGKESAELIPGKAQSNLRKGKNENINQAKK